MALYRCGAKDTTPTSLTILISGYMTGSGTGVPPHSVFTNKAYNVPFYGDNVLASQPFVSDIINYSCHITSIVISPSRSIPEEKVWSEDEWRKALNKPEGELTNEDIQKLAEL